MPPIGGTGNISTPVIIHSVDADSVAAKVMLVPDRLFGAEFCPSEWTLAPALSSQICVCVGALIVGVALVDNRVTGKCPAADVTARLGAVLVAVEVVPLGHVVVPPVCKTPV